MSGQNRRRHIAPTVPGGEPVCRLTSVGARARDVPIDRLLENGTLHVADAGYAISLPAGEESWRLANRFAEEEAECCPALALDVEAHEHEIVVRAAFA